MFFFLVLVAAGCGSKSNDSSSTSVAAEEQASTEWEIGGLASVQFSLDPRGVEGATRAFYFFNLFTEKDPMAAPK